MLKLINVRNFKSIHGATVKFRPITLLIGPNNSGKSSLISLLLTLKQTLASRNIESPFVLEGEYVQLGTYQDVVFRHNLKRKIQVEMIFRKGIDRRLFLLSPGAFTIDFSVNLNPVTKTIQLCDLEILDNKSEAIIVVENRRIISLFGKKVDFPTKFRGPRAPGAPYVRQRHFTLNVSLPESRHIVTREFYLNRVWSYLEQYFDQNFVYLGPLREYPRRYYISSGERPSDVGLRGERTVDFLYLDRLKITGQINQWLKRFGIAEEIIVAPVVEGVWKVELVNVVTKMKDNLKDVGFGVSQILPIVTEGIMARPGTTIIIEQPEIHLHPRAQARLADLFIDLANQDKSFIIETHSEHMLLRFARRIAEGSLKKKDIAVYEFKLTEDGTKITEIPFDDQGNLKKWPGGFFETELEETMKHVKAQGELSKER